MRNFYAGDNSRYGYSSAGYAEDGRMLGEFSARTYNLILGGVLAWGFVINALMCTFLKEEILAIPPMYLLVGYIVMALVGIVMSARSHNPTVSFIGYNLVVLPLGAVLTVLLSAYDGYSVTLTLFVTSIVVLGMTVLSTIFPNFFISLAPTLSITLLLVLLANLVFTLIGGGLAPTAIDWLVTLLFCGYIGYDYAMAQKKLKTLDNAIDSACELYVDIVNLFIRLLAIISRERRR